MKSSKDRLSQKAAAGFLLLRKGCRGLPFSKECSILSANCFFVRKNGLFSGLPVV
jgi:hypothetical protein